MHFEKNVLLYIDETRQGIAYYLDICCKTLRMKIACKVFLDKVFLTATGCRVVTEFYKQSHITLQVLKIFQFLFRYLPLKLNKEENDILQIKIK